MKFIIDTENKWVEIITDEELSLEEIKKTHSELPSPYNSYNVKNRNTVITFGIGGGGGTVSIAGGNGVTGKNPTVVAYGFGRGGGAPLNPTKTEKP